MLSEKHVKKFQDIYKKRFGKKISYEEAFEKGMNLLNLVERIYKPVNQEEYSKLINKFE
jgi:hypothetical protein